MARERGIRVMIISNGSAFSQSVIKKICEAEIAYVSISIDSADPATEPGEADTVSLASSSGGVITVGEWPIISTPKKRVKRLGNYCISIL